MTKEESTEPKYITFKVTREFNTMIEYIMKNTILHYDTKAELIRQSVREYYTKLIAAGLIEKKKV